MRFLLLVEREFGAKNKIRGTTVGGSEWGLEAEEVAARPRGRDSGRFGSKGFGVLQEAQISVCFRISASLVEEPVRSRHYFSVCNLLSGDRNAVCCARCFIECVVLFLQHDLLLL